MPAYMDFTSLLPRVQVWKLECPIKILFILLIIFYYFINNILINSIKILFTLFPNKTRIFHLIKRLWGQS